MIRCALAEISSRSEQSTPRASRPSISLEQHLRVDHHAVADHRDDVRGEDPGRQQVQGVVLVADDDRVTGVVAALVADDVVDLARRAGRWPCPCPRRPTGHRRARWPACGDSPRATRRKPLSASATGGSCDLTLPGKTPGNLAASDRLPRFGPRVYRPDLYRHDLGDCSAAGRRRAPSAAVALLSLRNCAQRSASSSSPIAAAARAERVQARRKPRLGSCSHGTGPWPFQPAAAQLVQAAVVAGPGVGVATRRRALRRRRVRPARPRPRSRRGTAPRLRRRLGRRPPAPSRPRASGSRWVGGRLAAAGHPACAIPADLRCLRATSACPADSRSSQACDDAGRHAGLGGLAPARAGRRPSCCRRRRRP